MEKKIDLKKIAIIILPIVFAVIAAIATALLVGGSQRTVPDEPEPPAESSTPSNVVVVVPPEDEYSIGLEYKSNGDGTCTVVGMGSCTDKIVIVPDKSPDGLLVMAIGKKAFMGENMNEVKLPASIISIGEAAFARCASLTDISVDGANPMYASERGVLFNREMTTLICYPSGKTDSTYTIPKSVTRIETMAFSSCKSLASVSYAGTEKQWRDVYVCVENDSLNMNKMTFAPPEK